MIFSIDERQHTTRSVELVCPRCGLDRDGHEVHPRRWVCLFGVPVVPLAEQAPLIVCDECGHMSDLGVLDVPTTAQLSTLLSDATVAALVLAGRSMDADNAIAVCDAAAAALCEAGFADRVATFSSELRELGTDVARLRLRRVGRELTAYGKQGFLHRVTAAVSSIRPVGQAQRDVLVQIGCDLGMAAPHINGILAVAALAA